MSLILAILVTVSGCSRPEKPEEVYRKYLDHLVNGRVEDAFELLSPQSRRALADRAEDGAGARPGLTVFRKAVQATGGGRVPLLPENATESIVRVEKLENGWASLEVSTPMGPRFPRLEQVGGRWLVALELPPLESPK